MADYYLIDAVSSDGAYWVEDVVFSIAEGLLYAKVGMKFQKSLTGVAVLDRSVKQDTSFGLLESDDITFDKRVTVSLNLPQRVVASTSLTKQVTQRTDFLVSQDA